MKTYRCYTNESPMSSWGHAMFNDDANGLCAYGETLYSVEKELLLNIWDLMGEIEEKIEEADEVVKGVVETWGIETMFDPEDMVICAGAYDNDALFAWFWAEIIEPKNISGIYTKNGAIVFDERLIVREGISTEIEICQ